jgi:hypothetical protein
MAEYDYRSLELGQQRADYTAVLNCIEKYDDAGRRDLSTRLAVEIDRLLGRSMLPDLLKRDFADTNPPTFTMRYDRVDKTDWAAYMATVSGERLHSLANWLAYYASGGFYRGFPEGQT